MRTTDIGTNERDLHIVYGKDYLGEEVSDLALASVKYMFTDLTDLRKYYIRLGFHLNEFNEHKGYYEFGYNTLEEFCEANLQMGKSAVSRCINVFREFNASDDVRYNGGIKTVGSAMELSNRWKDFSYTQLVEMLPLSPADRECVLPDMSCSQIREFKKSLKQKRKPVASTQLKPAALAQPEDSEEKPVVQSKIFNYDEMICKNGIVRQNYIKSRDLIGNHSFTILLYDSRGKEFVVNCFGDILEQSEYRLVIRMQDSFDPVSPLDQGGAADV